MQAGWRHEVASSGDSEAAGLDEERGFLGVGQSLLEEGDCGVVGGAIDLKIGQGRESIPTSVGWVGSSLKEEGDNGVDSCFRSYIDCILKCGAATPVLLVNSSSDARDFQQAFDPEKVVESSAPHESRITTVVDRGRIRATLQQGSDDVDGFSFLNRGTSISRPVVDVRVFLVQQI